MVLNKLYYVLFLNFILYSNGSLGQERRVLLNYYLEDKLVPLSGNFSLSFICKQDTLRARVEESSFYIPLDSLVNNKVNILFRKGNISLLFDSVKINQNDVEQMWVIKIDKKPFKKGEYWYLKDIIQKIKWLYTLNMGYGGIITEFRYARYPH